MKFIHNLLILLLIVSIVVISVPFEVQASGESFDTAIDIIEGQTSSQLQNGSDAVYYKFTPTTPNSYYNFNLTSSDADNVYALFYNETQLKVEDQSGYGRLFNSPGVRNSVVYVGAYVFVKVASGSLSAANTMSFSIDISPVDLSTMNYDGLQQDQFFNWSLSYEYASTINATVFESQHGWLSLTVLASNPSFTVPIEPGYHDGTLEFFVPDDYIYPSGLFSLDSFNLQQSAFLPAPSSYPMYFLSYLIIPSSITTPYGVFNQSRSMVEVLDGSVNDLTFENDTMVGITIGDPAYYSIFYYKTNGSLAFLDLTYSDTDTSMHYSMVPSVVKPAGTSTNSTSSSSSSASSASSTTSSPTPNNTTSSLTSGIPISFTFFMVALMIVGIRNQLKHHNKLSKYLIK